MFKLKKPNLDFGYCSIENIFINDFMPMANGIQIKVYLTGYKIASDKEENIKIGNYSIAKSLNIPLKDVLDSWDFWEKKGIIVKHEKQSRIDEHDYDVEFLSLIDLYIEKNFKNSASHTTSKVNPSDLASATYDPRLKDMYYFIDQLMRRPLEPQERLKILEWIRTYNFDPEVVSKAFEYSIESKNKKNFNYIKAVLRSWYDEGLLSVESIEEKLLTENDIFTKYRKIYSYLGYANKFPTEGDKEIMNRWINNSSLDFDFLLFIIKESSKKTSNVNMNYLNKIVSDIESKGIKTVEEFMNLQNSEKKAKESSVSKNPKQSNKFHNFSQDDDKYTNSQLEKILGIKK